MEESFLKQLGEKLKLAGLPALEQNVELLYDVLSKHCKEYKYGNAIAAALIPPAIAALDSFAKSQIDKIDKVEG